MKVEIFIHRTCFECNRVLEFLNQNNLINEVEIIDTERNNFEAIERGVLSTPSIFVDGELIFAGIVDYDKLLQILKEKRVPKEEDYTLEELVENLMNTILDSFAVASWIYVNMDFESLKNIREFIETGSGIKYMKEEQRERAYEKLINYVIENGKELINQRADRFHRLITSNFLREIYWLYGEQAKKEKVLSLYPLEVFSHWLMVRSAIGRVGLRMHRLTEVSVIDRIRKAYEYLINNYDSLWKRVVIEQKEIWDKKFSYLTGSS